MPIPDFLRERTQAAVGSLNAHRIILYAAVSTVAVTAAILNALRNYSNFYSVAIYLSKSSRSVLILANFGLLIALLCGHLVQQIFFGTLRAPERLYDRLWFFITESLLAFTIFRDEFDIPFALMFGFLLFIKSFHWLSSDRIEWMDQRPYPGPPLSFHVRMCTLFIILSAVDFLMFLIAVENTIVYGVGGMVLFASEYAILMASALNTVAKYALTTYELRRAGQRGGENAPPWENKSMLVFYIELITGKSSMHTSVFIPCSHVILTDFLKLTTYLVFFAIIITFYGLPLNIVRDVYITARSFITRLRALHRYQTATRNMDQRYPDATPEEMTQMSDRTCIICREEMTPRDQPNDGAQPPNVLPDGPNVTPKKLPCGHVFHFHCLRSWLERQQSCPTCRRTVLEPTPPGPQAPTDGQAGPQIPQAGGAPVNADQGGQNPHGVNNPLGFMGRLFGPGPLQQPAGVPPVLQNVPVVQGDRPQDVIIQYHIQYNPVTPPHAAAPAPEPLPIPRLREFEGPDGNFHPWEMDQRWFDNEQPQNPHNPVTQDTSSSSDAPAAPNLDSSESSAPLDPRRAAAESAIRRQMSAGHNQNPNIASSSSALPSVPTPNDPSPLEPEDNRSIPSLIPIYGVQMSELIESIPPREYAHNTSPSTSRQRFSSSLPSTLSESQLAVLDTITREAIDERLRILETVSHNVYQCIDDLMRLRSALPVLPSAPVMMPSATPHGDEEIHTPTPTTTHVVDATTAGEHPLET